MEQSCSSRHERRSLVIGVFVYKYLFLLSAALAAPLSAQEATPDLEVDEETATESIVDPTITVTANGLGTDIRNTGQPVTIIAREEIETVQGADVTRVLQRTPGLSFSRSGGFGSLTSVNIRGASPEQLLVLIDGVRVADTASTSGSFDFGNLLLPTVGKFDILRGANSTIWGSDAVAGVIDITTRAETGMEGTAEFGARDTVLANVSAGTGNDSVFVGLVGSWFQTDGFSAAASGTEPDGYEQFAIGATGFLDLTPTLELFAHANMRQSDLEIDGFQSGPPYGLIDSGDTQETEQYSGDIGLAYYGNDLTLRGAYSLSRTQRENLDADGALSFASDGETERVQLRGEYRVLGGLSVAFGGEHDWSRFDTDAGERAEVEITGVYAQLGWVMGALSLHAGGRVDDHEFFGTHTSFGGDASYRLDADWRLRASIGEGFKAPSLYQLYSFYGNLDLEPEESTSIDVGIERGVRDRGPYVALTAFRRTSDNLIGFAFTEDRPFGVYQNTAEARAQGIEAEAGIDLLEGLRIAGVYAYVDAEDRETDLRLARRPQHFGTLFADWQTSFGLKLGADLRVSGPSFDNTTNTRRLDGYEVLDLRAAYEFGENLELYGRVENVFDADYQTVFGYNTPGRGTFVGVRARM